MKRMVAVLLTAAAVAPLAAQENPFRSQAGTVKSALIAYTLSGDQAGTEELAIASGRSATRTNGSTRVFGKDIKMNQLTLETGDSSYRVDLEKKEGFRVSSQRRAMADEYDKLSPAEKGRFQANMQALAATFTQAFGAGGVANAAQVQGRETVAGQACEVHKMGDVTVCTLVGAPAVPLRFEGEVMCLRMNKVATTASVNGAVPADRFAVPTDIKWKDAGAGVMTDDQARQFVRRMASPELADSLAQSQRQMQAARDSARARGQASDSLTAAQHEQACRTMRDGIQLHFQVRPPNPAQEVQQAASAQIASADSVAKAAMKSAADTAINKAKKGIFGKIKKPKVP
ncbi:MAG TPA: hypothetical protein VEU73_13855 [Gemmatimonadales bacterium]|nr:hypothetical protein [Gemmatimonadales bacterium]